VNAGKELLDLVDGLFVVHNSTPLLWVGPIGGGRQQAQNSPTTFPAGRAGGMVGRVSRILRNAVVLRPRSQVLYLAPDQSKVLSETFPFSDHVPRLRGAGGTAHRTGLRNVAVLRPRS